MAARCEQESHSSLTYNGMVEKEQDLVEQPEELIYDRLFAPVNIRELLDTADGRGRIRRLPEAHLFFGVKELEDHELLRLLPHVTEEQWTAILDLDLWSRDSMSTGAFIWWQKQIIEAEDAVARKLIRAADPELWELTFKREIQIYSKSEEDDPEGFPEEGEWLSTPDDNFLIVLPQNADKARLLRALILRLYELDPHYAASLLASSTGRTSLEIEETGYQNRKGRMEELGIQDYFQALEIYSYLEPGGPLPEKQPEAIRQVTTLPARLSQATGEGLLFFQALALITQPQDSQILLEELVFVCNKVLSADQVSIADLAQVKRSIRKAVMGINVGLDWWSAGDLSKAAEGLRCHYLQSFFQMGYSRLVELRTGSRKLTSLPFEPEPGSLSEAFLEGLAEQYPVFVEKRADKIRRRLFRTRQDLEAAGEQLRRH